MRDPLPRSDVAGEMYWTTKEADNFTLFEFLNKTYYRNNKFTRKYTLQFPMRVSLWFMNILIFWDFVLTKFILGQQPRGLQWIILLPREGEAAHSKIRPDNRCDHIIGRT